VQGIMQNLTVVPWAAVHPDEPYPVVGAVVVVIGHRRLAAAKAAGLAFLPCAVAEMDHRTQIAVMLSENKQRADLTVPEQIAGMQMMLDLGATEAEIGERTGLGRAAVKNRLKAGGAGTRTGLQAAWERGATLQDFVAVAEIRDQKTREAVLAKAGTSDFKWDLNRALRREHRERVRPTALEAIGALGLAKQVDSRERYGGKYETVLTVDLSEWEPADGIDATKLDPKKAYVWCDADDKLYVMRARKKAPPQKKSKKELDAIRMREKIDAMGKACYEARKNWALSFVPPKARQAELLKELTRLIITREVCYVNTNRDALKDLKQKDVEEFCRKPGAAFAAAYVLTGDQRWLTPYANNYGETPPRYDENKTLEGVYAFLQAWGYEPGTEETQFLCGTHPDFPKKGEKKK